MKTLKKFTTLATLTLMMILILTTFSFVFAATVVDTTPPTVKVNPLDGATIPPGVFVVITATDKESGVLRVSYYWDNEVPANAIKISGSRARAQMPKEGTSHILHYTAIDKAGNYQWAIATFTAVAPDQKPVAPLASTVPTINDKYDKTLRIKLENKLSYQLGTNIYYTLDGTVPGPENDATKKWSGAIPIKQTTTLKAIAIYNKMISDVSTFTYTIVPKAPKIKNSYKPKNGIYIQAVNVKFSKIGYKKDTAFYYTLDGTVPTINSKQWDGKSIEIDETTTLKAIAVYNDESSNISTFVYNFANETIIQ